MSDIIDIDDEVDDEGELRFSIEDDDGDICDLFLDSVDLEMIAKVFGFDLVPIGGVN
jgi:hypothetical protein